MYSLLTTYSSSTFWSWLSFQSSTIFSNQCDLRLHVAAGRVELPELQRRILGAHRHPVDEGKAGEAGRGKRGAAREHAAPAGTASSGLVQVLR